MYLAKVLWNVITKNLKKLCTLKTKQTKTSYILHFFKLLIGGYCLLLIMLIPNFARIWNIIDFMIILMIIYLLIVYLLINDYLSITDWFYFYDHSH